MGGGVLPKKIDNDPTWRHEAIYTRAEAEQLISDERLPADRRTLYALKLLAALRHSEASGLTWAKYDATMRPLGAINLGKTKTAAPRQIPVHATLARVLATWKLSGWAGTYGRPPRADDLVVPTRAEKRRKPAASQVQLVDDLERIGLRSRAGQARNRRGHDLRRTMITLARADGAIDGLLRWVSHGPKPNEILDDYSSPPWESLCATRSLPGRDPPRAAGDEHGRVPGGMAARGTRRSGADGAVRVFLARSVDVSQSWPQRAHGGARAALACARPGPSRGARAVRRGRPGADRVGAAPPDAGAGEPLARREDFTK